jgi:hypothetical protein
MSLSVSNPLLGAVFFMAAGATLAGPLAFATGMITKPQLCIVPIHHRMKDN